MVVSTVFGFAFCWYCRGCSVASHPFCITSTVSTQFFFFFFNDPPPTEIYPLPLHDALPIWFVMLPLTTFESLYGRRQTTVISVKMAAAASVADGMLRAEEAMRVAHRLRPGEEDDFTVDTGEGLIAFWAKLTRVIFTVVPAVVGIGIVVGGIVIMNIMLMSVTERTREIGILKSLGASRRDIRRQFLAESAILSLLGGVAGLLAGSALAALVEFASPLPARVTAWSVAVALGLGVSVGIVFGVYPAHRAARLDPIEALRSE